MLADSVPKSLFLGSFQPSVVTKNKDLRSLARFILLLFQQPHEAVGVGTPARRLFKQPEEDSLPAWLGHLAHGESPRRPAATRRLEAAATGRFSAAGQPRS